MGVVKWEKMGMWVEGNKKEEEGEMCRRRKRKRKKKLSNITRQINLTEGVKIENEFKYLLC